MQGNQQYFVLGCMEIVAALHRRYKRIIELSITAESTLLGSKAAAQSNGYTWNPCFLSVCTCGCQKIAII